MQMGRQIMRTACNDGVPIVTPPDKFASVIWSSSKWMLRVERHDLRVAVRTNGNTVLECVGTASRFRLNVVALKPGVLPLMAKATVSLAGDQRLETHIEWKGHGILLPSDQAHPKLELFETSEVAASLLMAIMPCPIRISK
jgi:hypothetical protein